MLARQPGFSYSTASEAIVVDENTTISKSCDLDVPVVIINGENDKTDQINTKSLLKFLYDKPNDKIKIHNVPNAGHHLQIEKPDEVAPSIKYLR